MDNVFPHPFFLTAADCEPEPKAPCGCSESDCSPSTHEGTPYCMACDTDLANEIVTDRIERHDGMGTAPASCAPHIHGERDPTPGRRCRDCGAPIR